MAGYKLCMLGRVVVEQRIEFEAPDDRAAVLHAARVADHRRLELWQGERLVAKYPARSR